MKLTTYNHEALEFGQVQHFLLFQSVLFKSSSLYPGPKPTSLLKSDYLAKEVEEKDLTVQFSHCLYLEGGLTIIITSI